MRPSRYLFTLAAIFIVLFGVVIGFGSGSLKQRLKPKLGLDLVGGTTMTLVARTADGSAPDADRLEQAREIIEKRVNALRGVRGRGGDRGQQPHRGLGAGRRTTTDPPGRHPGRSCGSARCIGTTARLGDRAPTASPSASASASRERQRRARRASAGADHAGGRDHAGADQLAAAASAVGRRAQPAAAPRRRCWPSSVTPPRWPRSSTRPSRRRPDLGRPPTRPRWRSWSRSEAHRRPRSRCCRSSMQFIVPAGHLREAQQAAGRLDPGRRPAGGRLRGRRQHQVPARRGQGARHRPRHAAGQHRHQRGRRLEGRPDLQQRAAPSKWTALTREAFNNADGACKVTQPNSNGGGQRRSAMVAVVLDNTVVSAPAIQGVLSTDVADHRQLHQDQRHAAGQPAQVRRAAADLRRRRQPELDLGHARRRTTCGPACSPTGIGMLLVIVYAFFYYRLLGSVIFAAAWCCPAC